MSEQSTAVGGRQASSFFSTGALVIAVLVFLSFPATYFIPMVTGTKQFTLLRHLHGLAFFAWVGLYVAQTQLIKARKVKLHRELGIVGVALAGAMVPLGVWQTVQAAGERQARGVAQPFEFSLYNAVDIAVFSVAFAWAVYEAARRVEWHRRLMFVALLNLFGPAFSRITWQPAIPFPLSDMIPALVADAVLFLLAFYDRRALGQIHPVTLGALVVLIPLHAASPLIARGAWWNEIAPSLFGFW